MVNEDLLYTRRGDSYLFDLTPREREVAQLIVRGYSNPQIADALTISRETVKTHVSNILSKLGLVSRHEVRQAIISPATHEMREQREAYQR